GRSVRLGVPEKFKFLADPAKDSSFQRKMTSYLNTFWGPDHKVTIEAIDPNKTGTLSAHLVQQKKEESSKEEIRRQVENHPLIREAKSIFNTEIKSIREKS